MEQGKFRQVKAVLKAGKVVTIRWRVAFILPVDKVQIRQNEGGGFECFCPVSS